MVMTLAQRLDAARAALATARERDRITEALVRAAALIAPRVALFGVKREGLRVLAAPGSALRLAEGLVIPLPEGGLLDRAVSGQGPLHLLIEPSLSFAVGQPLGIPCIFEPVLAGGRTVLMLYLDRAGVAFDPRERTVLRELCDTARQSLEALLRLLGWVVPGGTPGAGPADRTRPSIRPHLATPIVTVDETEAPATSPPVSADSPEPEPEPAPAAEAAPEPDEPEPSPTTGGASSEPGFGDSSSAASRSRGRGSRGRAVITLKNPIRRDDPATVTPLPVRAESSALVRAQPLADEPPPPPEEPEYEDLTDDPEPDPPPARRNGPGLGLAPVPVPLGPDNGGDSPLVARFAAMFTRPPAPGVTIDLSDRPGTFGHARSDTPEPPPAGPQADMPNWIATAEPSGIEDPLPVAEVLRSAASAAEARVDHDPAATLPGAPRVIIDETARAPVREAEFDEWPRAASDTPTILDLSPPPTHAPLLVETRAAPDAKTILDIPPLDAAVPPETLIPNLIAPPGTAGAGRRRRAEPAEEEPVLVIPKTLRRSGGLTVTPHPMARRSDPDEVEGGPTLSMPSTLIGPRSGRRRGKHEPRSDASSSGLTMPRLVREADADEAPLPAGAAGPSEHALEDMSPATGPEAQADAAPRADATRSGSDAAPAEAPAAEGRPARPAADEMSAVEPTAADAAPGAALSEREIDAVIEEFLQNPAEWTSVSRLRALDERGLARLAARFPGPIDLANATNFPPPSAHGPLLRACVELGHAVSPHILALFASVRPQIRFYAAFLFQELRDPRCLRPLGELAFDPDPDVRLIATRVLESYSRVPDFAAVAAEIRDELDSAERDRQLLAVEAAGTLRDTLAVPRLIDLLAVRDKHVREAALEALCSITAKHHGYRAQRWRAWYAEHGQEPRIEWVIDGLRHRDEAVRRWAADELARITGQRIPFPAEGDRRSRELALRAWQAWWDSNREDFTAGP
ncbi:FrgA protein [Nannocystis exedens]|nr:FrgA protein [Nannocystis exedens]